MDSLLPSEREDGVLCTIMLSDLPQNSELIGPDPTESMIASVKAHGLLQPIILINNNDGILVAAGRRRVKAARVAKLETVPAIKFEKYDPRVVALCENAHRRENSNTDLNSIESLMHDGHSDEDIALKLGLHSGTIKKVLKLCALPPAIRTMYDEGKIRRSVAEKILLLKPELQAKLFDKLSITHQDVSDLLDTQSESAILSLDPEIFGEGEPAQICASPLSFSAEVEKAMAWIIENTDETAESIGDRILFIAKKAGYVPA